MYYFFREFLLLFFVLVIYFFSVGKDPILGDSLGFTVQAYHGFDFGTNSTNHFLYSNFLAFLHHIFPKVNVHNLFVGFSIACAIFNLYFFKRLTKIFEISDRISSILMLFLAFSFTFWRNAVITEVYSFYLVFILLFFYFYFLNLQNKSFKNFVFASFLFGLLFLIHIQTILLIPFYLYFLYHNFLWEKRRLFLGTIFPMFFFSILLIPVFKGKQDFFSIFFDSSYGSQFLNFNFSHFLKTLGRNLIFWIYNFLYFLPFVFLGFRKLRFKVPILLCFIMYIIFLLKHEVSDSYVFHLVPYIFLIISVGKSLGDFKNFNKYIFVLILPLFYFFTIKIVDQTSLGQKINHEIGFKGGARYFFFPPLNENPDITRFIQAYDENNLIDQPTYKTQYELAKEWQKIKKNENW